MKTSDDLRAEKKKLIDSLVSSGYISDERVIKAMLSVPRHMFIPGKKRINAYSDRPLSIGMGQTISAPHMVGIMTQHLKVQPHHRVLEIGAGSGYQAAVLSELADKGQIITLERIKQLADYAKANLEKTGYVNVEVIHHEGSRGYDNKAPYDRIIVTAAAPKIPGELTQQLADDGLMLIPVGSKFMQTLLSLHKKKDKIVEKEICGCVFVPLIGEEGW